MLLATTQAQAHAHLVSATPAAGSTSPSAPPALQINFTEALEPGFCKVEVTDQAGKSVTAGPLKSDAPDGKSLIVPVQNLTPGTYTVHWRATSVDTHKTQGTYRFTIGP